MSLARAAAPARLPLVGAPPLPKPRGPLSAFLVQALTRPPHELVAPAVLHGGDVLADDDLQLALYVCYELHYRSFAEVDEEWEWEPSLLAWRRLLESAFESALRRLVPPRRNTGDLERALRTIAAAPGGPSLSGFVEEEGTLDHLREFAVHRSAYQLKEADPHTWAIPRLAGEPKAALVLIQGDEYGGGVAEAMHASLFATTLRCLGLDESYGAYLDWLPGSTLATVNLVSMFGLHRRWRGRLVGHLAIFEMTSVGPMGRYARAIARLGLPPEARRFYEAHVEADAVHERIAATRLAGELARQEPDLAADILFGARAVTAVEARFAGHLLEAWRRGRTSLRRPLPASGLG